MEPNIPVGEAVNYPDRETLGPADYRKSLQRQHVSVNGYAKVGIQIYTPEGSPLEVEDLSLEVYEGDKRIYTYYADEPVQEGVYEVLLTPDVTRTKGIKRLHWRYVLGTYYEYDDEIVVTDPLPTYDSFKDGEKLIVEQAAGLFSDLFDSTNGGVFLTENFQSHFNLERIAQLSLRAMQKINMSYQPVTNFKVGPGPGTSLPVKYHGILVSATYLEVLRHLMRSYVEQPEFRNMSTTYTDRRDYLNRWKLILDEEKEDLDRAVANMKRDQLGLGSGALLVSGGIFGGARSVFTSSNYSSQTRTFRFYPSVTAMPVRY